MSRSRRRSSGSGDTLLDAIRGRTGVPTGSGSGVVDAVRHVVRTRAGAPSDRGSGVVDFVLVSALLLVLFLAVVQVGVVLHVRNVLTAAAAEGARYGANADRTPADGAGRTREVAREALSPGRAAQWAVSGRTTSTAAGETVEVEVTGPLPTLLPVGPLRLTVRGHALEEAR